MLVSRLPAPATIVGSFLLPFASVSFVENLTPVGSTAGSVSDAVEPIGVSVASLTTCTLHHACWTNILTSMLR